MFIKEILRELQFPNNLDIDIMAWRLHAGRYQLQFPNNLDIDIIINDLFEKIGALQFPNNLDIDIMQMYTTLPA